MMRARLPRRFGMVVGVMFFLGRSVDLTVDIVGIARDRPRTGNSGRRGRLLSVAVVVAGISPERRRLPGS